MLPGEGSSRRLIGAHRRPFDLSGARHFFEERGALTRMTDLAIA